MASRPQSALPPRRPPRVPLQPPGAARMLPLLLQYLKDLGPEAQGPDHFGNIAIDFAPAGGPPPGAVLGAWGPAAPAASMPVDSAQQTPTLLTEPLAAAGLHSQHTAAAQRDSGGEAVQQAAPAGRATRGRKTAGGPAASGGSRETKKELDLKKHLALQEKNRRTQRRFRERQKQRVAELEEQVATLQAQLAAASGGQAAPVRVAPTAMQQDVKCEPQASPRVSCGKQRVQPGSARAWRKGGSTRERQH